MHPNPYAAALGARNAIEALADTPERMRTIVEPWSDNRFERTHAPGKWSARLILVHLAQTEMALTVRARYALSVPGYAAQSFSQDEWLRLDEGTDGREALATYLALRRFNLGMWRRLNADQLDRTFHHPEYGELTVRWVMEQLAGHDLHHLSQIERIE